MLDLDDPALAANAARADANLARAAAAKRAAEERKKAHPQPHPTRTPARPRK